MVSIMDEVVGNITQALQQKGMWDNTLMVFRYASTRPCVRVRPPVCPCVSIGLCRRHESNGILADQCHSRSLLFAAAQPRHRNRSSDNGGPVDLAENAANNWPLRGGATIYGSLISLVRDLMYSPPMCARPPRPRLAVSRAVQASIRSSREASALR